MKKVSILIVLLLIACILAIPVCAAQSATATVSTSNSSLVCGDTFTVTVDFSTVTNCIAGGFMFEYDTNVFEYVSGAALVNGFSAAGVSTLNGNLAGYFMGNTATVDGSVFQITLKVKDNAAAGSYTISGVPNLVTEVNGVQEKLSCATTAATVNIVGTDAKLKLVRPNTSGGDLKLGDDIRASFVVNAKNMSYDRIYLEFVMNGVTTIADKLDTSTATTLRFDYIVRAAYMTEDIQVTVYGVMNGVTYRGEVLNFSIRKCVEAKMASWITNAAAANQCKLLMNMLYYGEQAQLQFNINTDNLATADLPQEYLDLINTEVPSMGTLPTTSATGKVTKITHGLQLQEKVKLSTVITGSTAFSKNVEIVVIHHRSKQGDTVTYTYKSGDYELVNSKNIRLYFDKIAPSQMRDELEITVYENGTAISATYVRSMDMVTNQTNYINNMPKLIYAIMNYADAAKAVFG